MVATKKLIDEIARARNLRVNRELEFYLLQEYGRDPFPNVWERKGLWHHVSSVIERYWSGAIRVRLKSAFELLSDEHEQLKSMYLERLSELSTLTNHLHDLERILKDNDLNLPNEDLDF